MKSESAGHIVWIETLGREEREVGVGTVTTEGDPNIQLERRGGRGGDMEMGRCGAGRGPPP